MKFYKYEATGNDFIIIEDLNNKDIVKVCDRHYGIGADGVIIVNSNENRIIIYNADGSEAKTCGNGLRCIGSYYKYKYNKDRVIVKTISNDYTIECLNNDEYEVSFPLVKSIEKEDNYYIVNSANLHIFTINQVDLENFSTKIRCKYDSNVEVVEILDDNTIKIKVNERGVGETYSCGSACVAIVSALYKDGLVSKEVSCVLKGGVLKVRVETDKVLLSGKANLVYKGEYYA